MFLLTLLGCKQEIYFGLLFTLDLFDIYIANNAYNYPYSIPFSLKHIKHLIITHIPYCYNPYCWKYKNCFQNLKFNKKFWGKWILIIFLNFASSFTNLFCSMSKYIFIKSQYLHPYQLCEHMFLISSNKITIHNLMFLFTLNHFFSSLNIPTIYSVHIVKTLRESNKAKSPPSNILSFYLLFSLLLLNHLEALVPSRTQLCLFLMWLCKWTFCVER